MKLINRIKTLWRLSGCEIGTDKDEILPINTKVSMLVEKPRQMAQIIKLHPSDEIEEAIKEEKNEN